MRRRQLEENSATILRLHSSLPALPRSCLFVGDTILVCPQIFDKFGNATVLPEGALGADKSSKRATDDQLMVDSL